MLTSVWPLVAKVTESHDKLMQSTWGGGSVEMGDPEKLPICLASTLPGAHGKELAGGGCPELPSSPSHGQEWPDPRDWRLHQLLFRPHPTPPHPTPPHLTCFFPTIFPPPGRNWAAGNLAPIWLRVGRQGLPKEGLGNGPPEPADFVQRSMEGGSLGRPLSPFLGGPALSVTPGRG